jgi:hypothetical protein
VTPSVAPSTPTPIGLTNNAHDVITTVQEKLNTVSAPLTDTVGGVDTTNTILTDDPIDPTAVTVAKNTTTADATANTFTSSINLAVVPGLGVDDKLGAGDGASAQGVQLNYGPVTSTASDNEIHALLQNFATGSVTVNTNAINANATGNSGSTTLAGVILPDYSSAAVGHSQLTFGEGKADWLDATGGLLASTVQIQSDQNDSPISNTATAEDNSIELSLTNTVDDASVSASPALDNNTIGATVAGNSSSSMINVQGGAPTFAGTAVVSNGQVNSALASASSIAAHNEASNITATIAADEDSTGDDAELHGALSVTNNTIASTASGNQALGTQTDPDTGVVSTVAGNRITLADGMSFQGNGNEETGPGADLAYNSGALTTAADGDLVIHNSQGNVGNPQTPLAITANTHNGEVAGIVNDLSNGAVTVQDNSITSTARGNVAASALTSGTGVASFEGSATLASQQTDYYSSIFSRTSGDVYAIAGDGNATEKSNVLVDGNTVSASGYGNSVSQTLSLSAVDQNLPLSGVVLTGGTDDTVTADGNAHSDGSLTVTNLQSTYDDDVNVETVSSVYAQSDEDRTLRDSAIAVTNNLGSALSVNNGATNTLALSGTGVGGGAGINSVQITDDRGDDGEVGAGRAYNEGVAYASTGQLDGSAVTVSGNAEQAFTYGGSASNTLSVNSGSTLDVDGAVSNVASTVTYADGDSLTSGTQPQVQAAYGVLNVQSLNGDLIANAVGAGWTDSGSAFAVTVNGDVDNSSVVNGGHLEDGVLVNGKLQNNVAVGGNTLVAAAFGADATNAASLTANNMETSNENFASVMNVTNAQETSGASSVTAQAAGGAAVTTAITDDNDLDNANVSTSYNTVQALAVANRAANSVAVTGNNIDSEADYPPIRGSAVADEEASTTDASFSVNNAQLAGGAVSATLLDNLEDPSNSASVATSIGGEVIDSSVASNGNTLSSGATGNRADNKLGLAGNGLATTSAITNFQALSEEAEITSNIGTPGGVQEVQTSPGTPDTLFGYNYVTHYVLDGECSDGQCPVGNAYDAIDLETNALSQAEINYLVANENWTYNAGPNTLTRSVTGVDSIPQADINGVAGSASGINLGDGTDPTYADVYVPGRGGVTVAIGDDVSGSTVAVNGNSVAGSVTGNSAANALTVSGNGVADGSDHLLTYGIADTDHAQADGDHMVTNLQVVNEDDTDLTSTVYSTFAIDLNDGVHVDNSNLSVDGNSQSSRAVANTAANSVELDANNTAAGAALVSSQLSGADVLATSEMVVSAPAASASSQVSMSNNTNLALGVVNDVTNNLTVDVNSAVPVTNTIDALVGVDAGTVAFGDHVLVNQQYAEDTVSANAATRIGNQEPVDALTPGILNGSVTVSGNTTTAEASANRAVNVANATAGSSLAAAVGVTNSQFSDTSVTSSATTTTGIALGGNAEESVAALNGGSITVGGNTTTALARGNSASNALNYSAGANYGVGSGNAANTTATVGEDGIGASGRGSAQAAVLNAQFNTGSVSASATDATYGIALNGDGGFPVATNGTMGVIGNAVAAAAYGNVANNSLTLKSLNTGMPTAAVANYQTNAGPVTATVTTVNYGVTSGFGAIAGSSVGVTGNAVTATAVGNSAASSIGTVR